MLSVYSCIYKGLIGAKPAPSYGADNERVVGGQNAERNEWKWQASNCFPCSATNIPKSCEITLNLVGIFWVIFFPPFRFLFSTALMIISLTSVEELSSMASTSWLQLTASSGWSSQWSSRPPGCRYLIHLWLMISMYPFCFHQFKP